MEMSDFSSPESLEDEAQDILQRLSPCLEGRDKQHSSLLLIVILKLGELVLGKKPSLFEPFSFGVGVMNLFWTIRAEASTQLPDNCELALNDALGILERSTRVERKPDEDPSDVFYELRVHLHAAAARSFRLMAKEGYGEDVRDTLERARQTASRMEAGLGPSLFWDEAPAEVVSSWAVVGLVLLELSRIRRAEGKHDDALHLLAEGVRYFAAAAINVQQPVEELGTIDEDKQSEEEEWREGLSNYLCPDLYLWDPETRTMQELLENKRHLGIFDVEPREAVELFESVRSQAHRTTDWKQVARDCEALAKHWKLWLDDAAPLNETIEDTAGATRVWAEFWNAARGWAEGRLSRNEYRELREEDERSASERRLRAYFFEGELWDRLPDRARKSLLDADQTWFARGQGRVESVYNDIRVAVESVCYSLIWEPLRHLTGDQRLLEFHAKDRELAEDGKNPSLLDYRWACGRQFMIALLDSVNVADKDRPFIQKDLPQALKLLGNLRNPAEHDPKRSWFRGEVAPIVQRFLGLNETGVLPRLVGVLGRERSAKQSEHQRS